MGRKNLRKNNFIQFALYILIIVLVSYLGSYNFFRLDLTSEKRYTLSDVTKDYLEELDDIVYLKVYLEGDDLPPGFKRLRNSLREMLDEFIVYAGDNIQFEFINPSEDTDKKKRNEHYKEINKRGLTPITLFEKDDEGKESQKLVFPGVILTYGDRELALDLLSNNPQLLPEENLNNSVSELEYNLLNTIKKLHTEYIPTIGFTTDHGEISGKNSYSIRKALAEYYNVKNIELDEKLSSLSERSTSDSIKARIRNKFDLLVIPGPKRPFSDKDKFILDQYVMHGGKIIWLIDGINVEWDSLMNSNYTMGMANELNLDDQLFNYGIRINNDLLQDIQCSKIPAKPVYGSDGRPQYIPFDWVYWPLIQPDSEHSIVKNLDLISSKFVSSIDTVRPEKGIKKTVLLTSSKYTKTIQSPVRVSLDLLNVKPEKQFYSQPNKTVAILLEGKFESVFDGRVPKEIKNDPFIDFKNKSVETSMIFISDADIAYNPVRTVNGQLKPFPPGYDIYSGAEYANSDFIVNAANHLLDESGIMNLRNREVKLRLLDKTVVNENSFIIRFINVAVPVILILIFAVTLAIIRKKKNTTK